MIRVLVAEDSSTTRELLVALLRADPDVQVVGEAKNGAEAVEMARRLKPDVITMDIQMPVMDGFEATRRIMIEAPTPIVIVSSSFRARDVEVSMHALRAGALSVLAKPDGIGSPEFEASGRQFLQSVKAMSQVKVVRRWADRMKGELPSAPRLAGGPARGRIVAVAASTGGPAALHQILTTMPGDFCAPVLVVQHISAGFVDGLARWLNDVAQLKVKVAESGEPLSPSTVYLAPDDRHLGVSSGGSIQLSSAPPIGGFRPSGTFLFESVARGYGGAAIGLVLTGMGQDGVQGLQAIRDVGGTVIAQDENSSVVFGMPGAAIAAGCVDWILPLSAVALRLVEAICPEGKGDSYDTRTHH
ncbi:MAG: chemotaxis-specific protein-glutamate methyltransferase CheB [Acidobacteria bacterium]|nr:chemotaxis-specific protein-glutamate methyltransferase CheB [Acidobacteriota bacterium]